MNITHITLRLGLDGVEFSLFEVKM